MKKTYITPQISCIEIQTLKMIAASEETRNKYNTEITADDDEIR